MTEKDLQTLDIDSITSLLNDDSFSSLSYTIYSNVSNASSNDSGDYCYGVDSLSDNINNLDFNSNSIAKIEISKDSKFFQCDDEKISQDTLLKAKNGGYDFIAFNSNGKVNYIVLNEDKISNRTVLNQEAAIAEMQEKAILQQQMAAELSKLMESNNAQDAAKGNAKKKVRPLTEKEKKEREEKIEKIHQELRKYGFIDNDTKIENVKELNAAVEELKQINGDDFSVDPGYLEQAISRMGSINTDKMCQSIADAKEALGSIEYSFSNANSISSSSEYADSIFKGTGNTTSSGLVANYVARLKNLKATLTKMNPYYDVEVQRATLENIEEFGSDLNLTEVEKTKMLENARQNIYSKLSELEDQITMENNRTRGKILKLLDGNPGPNATALNYLTELHKYASALTAQYTDKTYGGIYEKYRDDESVTDEELEFLMSNHQNATFDLFANKQYVQDKKLGETEAKWYESNKTTKEYYDIDMRYLGTKMSELSSVYGPLDPKSQAFFDDHKEEWNLYSKETFEASKKIYDSLAKNPLAVKRTETVGRDGNTTTAEYYECYVDSNGNVVSRVKYDEDRARMKEDRKAALAESGVVVNSKTLADSEQNVSDEELGITPSVRLVKVYTPYSLMDGSKQYIAANNMYYNASYYNNMYSAEMSEYSSTVKGGKLYDVNALITESQELFGTKGGVNLPAEIKTVSAEDFRANPERYNRILDQQIELNQELLDYAYNSTSKHRDANIKYYENLVDFYSKYKEALNNRIVYEDYAKTIPGKYADNMDFYTSAGTLFNYESVMAKPRYEWSDDDYDFVLVEKPISEKKLELLRIESEISEINEELEKNKPALCANNYAYINASDGRGTPEDIASLQDAFLADPVNAQNKKLVDKKTQLNEDSVRISAEIELLNKKKSDYNVVMSKSNRLTVEEETWGDVTAGYIFKFYSDDEHNNQVTVSAEEAATEIALYYGDKFPAGIRIMVEDGTGKRLNVTQKLNTLRKSANHLSNTSKDISSSDVYSVMVYDFNNEKLKTQNWDVAKQNMASYYKDIVQLGNRQGGIELSKKWLAKGTDGVLGQSFWNGCVQWAEGMKNAFGGADGILSARDYANMYYSEGLGSLYGDIVRSASEITTSIGNMAPSIAMSVIAQAITVACPPAGAALTFVLQNASTISMGLSAGGNAWEQGMQEGLSRGEAFWYGAMTGASEALLEKVLGGIPGLSDDPNLEMKILKSIFHEQAESAGVKFLTEMLSEGVEESLQEILDPKFKTLATRGRIQEKVDWGNVAKSGLYGMITAGVMQGGGKITGGMGKAAIQEISQMTTGTKAGLSTLLLLNSEGGVLNNLDKLKSDFSKLTEARKNGTMKQALDSKTSSPATAIEYKIYEASYNLQLEKINNMDGPKEKSLAALGKKLSFEEYCETAAIRSILGNNDSNSFAKKLAETVVTEGQEIVPFANNDSGYKINQNKYNEILGNLKSSNMVGFQTRVAKFLGKSLSVGDIVEIQSALRAFGVDQNSINEIFEGNSTQTEYMIDPSELSNISNALGLDVFEELFEPYLGKKLTMAEIMEVMKLLNHNNHNANNTKFINVNEALLNKLFVVNSSETNSENTAVEYEEVKTETESKESKYEYSIKGKNFSPEYQSLLDEMSEEIKEYSIDAKTGSQLEELFFQDEYVIGIHRTGGNFGYAISEGGLNLTGHLSSGALAQDSSLDLNISFFNKTNEVHYLDFLINLVRGGGYKSINGRADVVLIAIPKSDINNLEKITYKTEDGQTRLKSDYIVGFTESDTQNHTLSGIKFNTNSNFYNSHPNLEFNNSNVSKNSSPDNSTSSQASLNEAIPAMNLQLFANRGNVSNNKSTQEGLSSSSGLTRQELFDVEFDRLKSKRAQELLGLSLDQQEHYFAFIDAIRRESLPDSYIEKYENVFRIINSIMAKTNGEITNNELIISNEEKVKIREAFAEAETEGNNIIRNHFSKELKEQDLEVRKFAKMEWINLNNKAIPVYRLQGQNFKLLTHAILADNENHSIIAENILKNPIAFAEKQIDGNNYISTALISNDWMFTYGNDLIFGFSNVPGDSIMAMAREDQAISVDKKLEAVDYFRNDNYTRGRYSGDNIVVNPEMLIKKTKEQHGNEMNLQSYNEIVLARDGIMPSYILCFDTINETSKKAAEQYGIPIYLIERQFYSKDAYSKSSLREAYDKEIIKINETAARSIEDGKNFLKENEENLTEKDKEKLNKAIIVAEETLTKYANPNILQSQVKELEAIKQSLQNKATQTMNQDIKMYNSSMSSQTDGVISLPNFDAIVLHSDMLSLQYSNVTEKSVSDMQYAIKKYMEKYGVSQEEVLARIEDLIKYRNYNYMTSYGGARDVLRQYNMLELAETLEVIENIDRVTNADINAMEYAIKKYMERYFVSREEAIGQIEELIKNKNYNYMTSHGGARDVLKQYDFKALDNILTKIKLSEKTKTVSYSTEQPNNIDSFFQSNQEKYSSTYGVDQGAIYSMFTFCDENGKEYSYREAKAIVNKAIENHEPIPRFKKYATQQYFDLKNKLCYKYGLTDTGASVILSTIDDAGACSYAATCNEIIATYKNSPQLFEQIFGFPMYKTIDGVTYLNYSELLVDMYVNINMEENGGRLLVRENNHYTLNTHVLSGNVDPLGRRMLNAEWQQYLSGSAGKNRDAINQYLNSKGLSYSSDILVQKSQNVDSSEMMDIIGKVEKGIENGNQYSLGIYFGKKEIRMLSANPKLYRDCSTFNWNEGGGHAVFVTGIGENGFIVSSWGGKYVIPYDDLIQDGAPWVLNESVIGY